MSYLPYGGGGPFSWLAASGSSVAVHGGVLAIALGSFQPLFDLTVDEPTSEPEFTITLQQLDSDTLAGLVERDGLAGVDSEALTDLDTADAVEAEAGEEVAALQPEAAPRSRSDAVDQVESEAADEVVGDEVPEQPEAEAVEPVPEAETVEAAPEVEAVEPVPEAETVEAAPEVEAIEPLPEAEVVEALPEAETIEPVPEAEALEPDSVEVLESLSETASLEEVPEAESLEPLPESETLEPLPEPETLAALPEAETLSPLPEPETLGVPEGQSEAISPLPTAPEVAAPVDANPLLSDRATALVPEAVDRVAPTATAVPPVGRTSLSAAPVSQADVVAVLPRGTPQAQAAPERTAIQPAQTAAPRVEAVQRPAAAAVAPRPRPVAAPPPPPSAQDLAIGELLGRIRTAPAYDCLIALPRRDGPDGVGLALIAASDREISTFVDSVLTQEDADIRQTRTFVDPRQCPALAYVRQNRDYPATRLGIRLERAEVESGDRIIGRVRGTAGKYVVVLLIDSNGVVRDMQRFNTFSGNEVAFNMPVNRTAAPRDTSQLLLAIASQRPLNIFRERDKQLAQDVFRGLEGELATGTSLAVATFDVR